LLPFVATSSLELLPFVLLFQPTSGLDSFLAESVMDLLLSLAQAGRTVVTTIHQPSSDVFGKFDSLMLMAEGAVAYSGPSKEAIEYFKLQGLECPLYANPADFYIKCLAIVPEEKSVSVLLLVALLSWMDSNLCSLFSNSGKLRWLV
jgi:ABC-type multidrug transport system ATPase subunit